jgi:hypothetical protein
MKESRYGRGLGTMKTIFGPGIESALQGLAASSPDLARCLVEFPFAKKQAQHVRGTDYKDTVREDRC